MIFAILFEVRDPARRARVIQRIKAYGAWMSYFDGAWLVDTPHPAIAIRQDLLTHMAAATDTLLIVRVDPQGSNGLLPQDAWDWLNARHY